MAENVVIDGVSLNQLARGSSWKITSLEGWWDSAESLADDIRNEFNDGETPGQITYAPREIIIKGRVIARNHDYLHEAMQHISSLAFRQHVQLSVSGHGTVQSASVRVNGRIRLTPRSDKYLQFEIPLKSISPFKYGEARSFQVASGDTAMAFHRGTVEAWPTVTVTGNMPGGYSVRFGGAEVTVTESLLPGETHRIEYRTRRLYINNEFYMGLFGSATFRPCKPGVRTEFRVTPASGSGTGRAQLNDTYI